MSFFDPLPPPIPPSQRVWAPPAWDRPSEGTVPATLAIDALLHEDEDAVWTIPTLDVFPNGFRVNVALQLNPHRQQDIQQRIHRGPMGMMRIGVRFADGRVGGQGGGRAFPGAPGIPKDENGVPTVPIVGFGGGGGGGSGWRFSAWVFPLPPDGPLEIYVAPPQPATGEFKAVVEGSAVRAAAEKARVLWS